MYFKTIFTISDLRAYVFLRRKLILKLLTYFKFWVGGEIRTFSIFPILSQCVLAILGQGLRYSYKKGILTQKCILNDFHHSQLKNVCAFKNKTHS